VESDSALSAAIDHRRRGWSGMLLTRTDMTIGSIAAVCGFADLYHFSHRFTGLYGVPPSDYRRVGSGGASILEGPGTRRHTNAMWA
jgi:AraC-like DNA-binding protein